MHINWQRIDEITGDDNELKVTLCDMFLETFDNCLKQMKESLNEGREADNSFLLANHQLKGSAINIGFEDLHDICEKIAEEKQIISQAKGEYYDLLKKIRGETDGLIQEYKDSIM